MTLQKGMYVRCPILVTKEDDRAPRIFALGQVTALNRDLEESEVVFHDIYDTRKYYDVIPSKARFDLDEVERCKILENSQVVINCKRLKGEILWRGERGEDEFEQYYVRYQQDGVYRTEMFPESALLVHFTRADINPIRQLTTYELHKPKWYLARSVVSDSLHTLENATFGFNTLVGSRALLLPHQVDTIVRAVRQNPCRFMLADEVGLGKTIEACVIMKGLKERIGNLKVLIIAPDSLVHQWHNELSYKFWLDIPVWYSGQKYGGNDLIFPLEKLNTPEGKVVLEKKWDLCIVDETHRLLAMENEYDLIFSQSQEFEHMLLLTATPIQERRSEYLKLLALLVPERYGTMSFQEFDILLNKQKQLREKVHALVRDLDDYEEDDLAEDYLDDLRDIVDIIEDRTFEQLIQDIDIESSDHGLGKVQLALAYLGEHYQIERHIIRHRRRELQIPLPKRKLEVIHYPLSGAGYKFYENEIYEGLLAYLEEVLQRNPSVSERGEFVRLLLSAMFSSPWALRDMLKSRLTIIQKSTRLGKSTAFLPSMNVPRREGERRQAVLCSLPAYSEEKIHLNNLLDYVQLWEKAVEGELERVHELYENPDLIHGRLMKAIDYLAETLKDEKYVIFSSWIQTLLPLEKALRRFFGMDAVATFHCDMEENELQSAVDRFQSDPTCRFMLCDELGGEGRNFQIAQAILHVDLPWSPVPLEQRIGRLDRIGRSEEVLSVVLCSSETIEDELLKLWDQGLNIFTESLSGLEIALSEIQKQIYSAFDNDLRYGLSTALEYMEEQSRTMRDLIEEERYYDMAKQLDRRMEDQLVKLMQKFDDNKLYETMMAWTYMAGLNAKKIDTEKQIVLFQPDGLKPNATKNTYLVPPDMEEARRRARRSQEIRGTFSREISIQREDLIFYAPGDPFFDAIVNNAKELYKGRCCAMCIPTDISWEGLIFIWNPVINLAPLLKLGEGVENIALAQGYIPLQQFVTFEGFSEEDRQVDEMLIRERLQVSSNQICHLGKRGHGGPALPVDKDGKSNLEWFKYKYPLNVWRKLVDQAYQQSQEKTLSDLRKTVEGPKARTDFKRYIDGVKASNLYYGRHDDLTSKRQADIYKALIEGISHARIRLDSVAYVWMVNKDEQSI